MERITEESDRASWDENAAPAERAALEEEVARVVARGYSHPMRHYQTEQTYYSVPFDRSSFHRIVKSFIKIENELYEQEQAQMVHPRPSRDISTLNTITKGSQEHSRERALRPDDLAISGGATISSDFAYQNPSISTFVQRAEPEGYDTNVATQRRPPHIHQRYNLGRRESNVTAGTANTARTAASAGTEGTVENAAFIPEALHGDDGLQDIEHLYLPFWERYSAWDVLLSVVFLLIFFGFLIAIAVQFAKQDRRRYEHNMEVKADMKNGSRVEHIAGPAVARQTGGEPMDLAEGAPRIVPMLYLI